MQVTYKEDWKIGSPGDRVIWIKLLWSVRAEDFAGY
jgi:hypothetical protein